MRVHRYELLPVGQDGENIAEQDPKALQKASAASSRRPSSTIIMATTLGLIFVILGVVFA